MTAKESKHQNRTVFTSLKKIVIKATKHIPEMKAERQSDQPT